MTRTTWNLSLVLLLAASSNAYAASGRDVPYLTTAGAIAIANLDHQIRQHGEDGGIEELLLLRSRFLADYEALDRVTELAEGRSATAGELLQRARARSAVHRFADALSDVKQAEVAGARREEVVALRASILVATGRASEVVPQLEAEASRRPGYASRSALAVAYAAAGRLEDADRLYAAALEDLGTTSPFPYAWIELARGMMWAEQGGDRARARSHYELALAYLPEFVTANIHLAELDVADGDVASAMARLERVVAASGEPEALGLLGQLHVRIGEPARGRDEIARARKRYEELLARHSLAFADHAVEFYLGAGADAARAWVLAQQNLSNRQTGRAVGLAIRAARAAFPNSVAR